jgi:hypothetical protein
LGAQKAKVLLTRAVPGPGIAAGNRHGSGKNAKAAGISGRISGTRVDVDHW